MPFSLGIDVGYNGLKLAYGSGETPYDLHLPAGAGPLSAMPGSIDSGDSIPGVVVEIDGEEWVAGVDHRLFEGRERELHADYPSTKSYRALFYASLILSQQTTIDTLVTGLPVDQALNLERRTRLESMLIGAHEVTKGQIIEVKKVIVLPQPVGAYVELLMTTDDPEAVMDGKVVVVDPGFFSCDSVAVEGGSVRRSSSGTTKKAMSRVLETASSLMNDDFGEGAVTKEKLEKAIHLGKETILVYGKRVEFKGYIEEAASVIAPQAISTIRQQMREDDGGVDIVLIVGGGANQYASSATEYFSRSQIVIPENPVLSNARGFYFHGAT